MKGKVQIPVQAFQSWLNRDQIQLDQGLPIGLAFWDDPTIIKELLCGICTNISWDVMKCKVCGQCYCSVCIQNKFPKYSAKCLKCNSALVDTEPDMLTAGVLTQLNFACFFKDDGCQDKINYRNYENHLSTCLFRRRCCYICNIQYYQKDQSKHRKDCWDVEVKCENCNTKMTKKDKNKHKEVDCLQQVVKKQGEVIVKLVDRLSQLEVKIQEQNLIQKVHIKNKDDDFEVLEEEVTELKKSSNKNQQKIEKNSKSIIENYEELNWLKNQFKDFVTEMVKMHKEAENLNQKSIKENEIKIKELGQNVDKNISDLQLLRSKAIQKEKPFEFTDHSRLFKQRQEKSLQITLKEEKRDNKGNKHGAVFEIFNQSVEQPMEFNDRRRFCINFEVTQLKGSVDVGILVNDEHEISLSSKGKIKKRINSKEDKIWKLVEQREIDFNFVQGDRVHVEVEGWIMIVVNASKNQRFRADIRQEIGIQYYLEGKRFCFSGGLYDESDSIIFYQ